ncbi:MAG: response regulator [Acidobacteria bacterium]|nr:response regulator [Acidobacteriota bacterium]
MKRSAVNAPPTILVVDDETSVLSVIEAVLRRCGYRVLAASNAGQALEIAKAEPRIDLLLADVVLPGMNGPDLAETLIARRREMRVLFTAGMPDTAYIRERVFNRNLPLLPKPFLPVDLVHAVGDVMARPRGARTHRAPAA